MLKKNRATIMSEKSPTFLSTNRWAQYKTLQMNWHKYRVQHSQKNVIDLYCRQDSEKLEVYITNGDDNDLKVLTHDYLIGSLSDLLLDQNSNTIKWELVEHDFSKCEPEFDMAQARERNGHMNDLDYLKYHIANAINGTFDNRSFSRYLKKNIVGKWVEKDLTLEFYDDDTYIFIGKWKPSTTLAGVPERGTYKFSRNMILFWGIENRGLRSQVVELVDGKLYLPGFSGKLFFTMTKE